jgi:uncharacterized protein (DUF4415 family)
MARKERIVRASADEIQAMRRQGKTRSDWAAAERMTEAEVARLADEDDGPLPEGWESTVEIGLPEPAQPVNIRLDAAVLRWFRASGPGYQTRINAVLRAFVRARQRAETPQPDRG